MKQFKCVSTLLPHQEIPSLFFDELGRQLWNCSRNLKIGRRCYPRIVWINICLFKGRWVVVFVYLGRTNLKRASSEVYLFFSLFMDTFKDGCMITRLFSGLCSSFHLIFFRVFKFFYMVWICPSDHLLIRSIWLYKKEIRYVSVLKLILYLIDSIKLTRYLSTSTNYKYAKWN